MYDTYDRDEVEMEEPARPTWWGFSEITDSFLKLLSDAPKQGRARYIQYKQNDLENFDRQIRHRQDELRIIRASIADYVAARAKTQAELDALLAEPEVEVDEATAFRQLTAIRHLPGVKGIRQAGRSIVIHVRTQTVYQGRLYFLGDFELHFSRQEGELSFELSCTKNGIRRKYRNRVSHPYWSGGWSSEGGDAGYGSFCFGSRADVLYRLLELGDVSQVVQLIIASMNQLNSEHIDDLRYFREIRLTARRRRELLALKAQGYDIDLPDDQSNEDASAIEPATADR